MNKFKKNQKVICIRNSNIDTNRKRLIYKGEIKTVKGCQSKVWFTDTPEGHGAYNIEDFKLYKEPKIIEPPQRIESPQSIASAYKDSKEFKVGDKVIITKGYENWNSKMDQYIGRVLTIKSVYNPIKCSETKFEELTNRWGTSDDDQSWSWNAYQGHFKHYEEPIKEFPKFTILKQINTLTENNVIKEVLNNEGNMFEIGDNITLLNKKVPPAKIIKFRLNKENTNICAIIGKRFPNGIGIDKIQHFVEFKPKKPEFILPEYWCVHITDNNLKTLSDWRGTLSKPRSGSNLSKNALNGYITNRAKECNSNGRYYPIKPTNIPEITFEQFQQYVLNIQPTPIQDRIFEIPEEIVEESLLDKAKRLYPPGTRFRNKGGYIQTVMSNGPRERKYCGKYDIESGGNVIYCDGIWGEIIKD